MAYPEFFSPILFTKGLLLWLPLLIWYLMSYVPLDIGIQGLIGLTFTVCLEIAGMGLRTLLPQLDGPG